MVKIDKHTRPTRYDKYPLGTLWEMEDETFIQVNEDENNPTWHPWGYVLQVAAHKCIKSDRFIKKVLDIFRTYS